MCQQTPRWGDAAAFRGCESPLRYPHPCPSRHRTPDGERHGLQCLRARGPHHPAPSVLASVRTLFRRPPVSTPCAASAGPSRRRGDGSSPQRLEIRGCGGYPRLASRPGYRRLLIEQSCGASATRRQARAPISFFSVPGPPLFPPVTVDRLTSPAPPATRALTLFPPCRVHAASAILARPKNSVLRGPLGGH
jgi:hypothetical protein